MCGRLYVTYAGLRIPVPRAALVKTGNAGPTLALDLESMGKKKHPGPPVWWVSLSKK